MVELEKIYKEATRVYRICNPGNRLENIGKALVMTVSYWVCNLVMAYGDKVK
jgi:hypothetical protein